MARFIEVSAVNAALCYPARPVSSIPESVPRATVECTLVALSLTYERVRRYTLRVPHDQIFFFMARNFGPVLLL